MIRRLATPATTAAAIARIPSIVRLSGPRRTWPADPRALGSVAALRKPFNLPEVVSLVAVQGRRGR